MIVPPQYVALVQQLAALIPQWCRMHPSADLRWVSWEGAVFAGNLGPPWLTMLAATPDAVELLLWLDDCTNSKATLLQARVALELCGKLDREYVTAPEFAGAFTSN